VTSDPVFLDTVGLLALWDKSDQWHETAEEAFARLASGRTPLITTGYILLESGNAAARRPYRNEVDALRANMEAGGFLVWPTKEDWSQAWSAYIRGEADEAGIVDHVSFLVMRRLQITTAFTNDSHYRAAGFTTLF
jgi:uncharacterized protein